MRSVFAILIVLSSVLALANSSYGNGETVILADQTSCEIVSGTWDSQTSTCTIQVLNIQNQDVFTIATGVTLVIDTHLANHATLTNNGTLIIPDTASFSDIGHFENLGTLHNLGRVTIVGSANNTASGIIDNQGEITGTGDQSTFANNGQLNSTNALTVEGGAKMQNFNLMVLTGGTVNVTPSSSFLNSGIILFCDTFIEGSISGNPLVNTCSGVNNPPTIFSPATVDAFEETPFEFYIPASDPDYGQILSYGLAGQPAGMMVDSATGVITWNPDETLGNTSWTFDIIVTDSGSPPLSDTETITVQIAEVNVEPRLDPIEEPPQTAAGNTVHFIATATDSDLPQQNLAFGLANAPSGAQINPITGEFTWVPTTLQAGTFTFDVTVSDNGLPPLSDVETISIIVIAENTPPVITPTPVPTATEDTLFQYQVIAFDADLPVQNLEFSLSLAPQGMTIDPALGLITWIPDETQGGTTQQFEVVVSDNVMPSMSDSELFEVVVIEANLPPVVTPIPPQIAESNVPFEYQVIASDPDVPANSITYSLGVTAPIGMTIDPLTGLISYTADISQAGTHTFDVIVTDNGSPPQSHSEPFEIKVLMPVSAPVITSPPDGSTINNHTPTISGTAEPGSTVKVFVDGIQIGTTVTDSEGTWSFTPSTPLSDGQHTLTAISVRGSGNTSLPSAPVKITITTKIVLTGIIRDLRDAHPDFEYVIANDPGVVKQQLGGDGKPAYASTKTTKTTTGIENFNDWYNNVSTINECTTHDITLNSSVDNPGLFIYSNTEFFPIDGSLFGNEGNSHNYHFTYQLKAKFVYKPGQSVTITGDDDIWVFINKKLALDQGGVLPPRTGTVNLDELGLVEGQTYDFDLFFAERHTVQSNLGITTNIPLIPLTPGQCNGVDAINDAAVVSEGNPISINELSKDFSATAIKSVNAPMFGTAVISEGLITYTPALGFVGKDYFTYEAQNDEGSTDSAVVVVEVKTLKDFVIDKYIARASDDAEESRHKVDLKDNDLDMGEKDYVGLRFEKLEIPKGATITNAYVQFAVEDKRGDRGFVKVRLFAQDSGNTETFTTAKDNISLRPKTTAFVDWTVQDWKRQNDAGSAQRTPNISSLIQKVVDRPDWNSNNSIVLLVFKQSSDNDRDAHSFDGKKSMAPRLHIEFKTLTSN